VLFMQIACNAVAISVAGWQFFVGQPGRQKRNALCTTLGSPLNNAWQLRVIPSKARSAPHNERLALPAAYFVIYSISVRKSSRCFPIKAFDSRKLVKADQNPAFARTFNYSHSKPFARARNCAFAGIIFSREKLFAR
jgi:hypothetical protein